MSEQPDKEEVDETLDQPPEQDGYDEAWEEVSRADEQRAPADEPDPEPEPEAPPQAEPDPAPEPETDEAKDPGKVKQELKEWQGRLKKTQAEVAEWEARKKTLRQTEDDRPTPPPSEDDPYALSDEEKAALDGMGADFKDFDLAITAKAKQIVGEYLKSKAPESFKRVIDEQVNPRLSQIERTSEKRHFDAIAEKHGDWEGIVSSGELDEWIDTLPYRDAKKYVAVKDSGSAGEAIAMLDHFKRDNRKEPDPPAPTDEKPSPNPVRERQRQGAQAVRARSGGPPPAGIPKDDFDSAFDAASR